MPVSFTAAMIKCRSTVGRWFFWLMYITITPIAITILLLGDVYYKKRGKVKSFGIANRIVAGLIALVILWNIARLFTQV